ncbi:hypothetical protein DFH08DRAFT_807903 [Mycena albidolilacea]|uniref:Uncharacterized protein n=1 Tax=Mycena albidolilacea TaxID=1033008 RepID=A0AAD7A4R5_9AGAR|nr:hypothetical protein DFH08DRAFT_807903 [Mycena albidolilacea]
MGWATEELKAVLKEYSRQYFTSKGDDREQLADTIVSELDKVKSDLAKPLHAKIKVWYNHNATQFRRGGDIKESDRKIKTKRWDAKAVARDLHQARYDEIKSEVIAAGSAWNDVHRSTMARLWDELTEKDQQTCQETASSRNSGEISEKDKRELACGNADKEVTAFVKQMHTIYDTDGKAQTSVYEIWHETMSISPRFTQQFPRWKIAKGLPGAFMQYSELFAEDSDGNSDEDEDTKKSNKSKYPWAILGSIPEEELPDGLEEYPSLPEVPTGSGVEWINGIDTGSPSPPWVAMSTPESAHKLISNGYLPEGLGLQDPSQMVKEEIETIYKFWMRQQKANKLPLRFKVAEAKQKVAEDKQVRLESLKRKKVAYVETSNDETGDHENSQSKQKKKKANDADPPPMAPKSGKKAQKNGRPKPRPYLDMSTRKSRLLALTNLVAYQSLVLEVLTSAKALADGHKSRNPAWISWDTDDVALGSEFFDMNTSGYLSNLDVVVKWMGTNPHISDLSQGQAAEILLTVGLAYRGAKDCANADPDSPLGSVPFEVPDLVKVEDAIWTMLAQSKKGLKFGISQAASRSIENGWRKVCLEVGFSEGDIKTLGKKWKGFVETYAMVDSIIADLVKGSQPRWQSYETNWEEEMKHVSSTIQATVKTAQPEENLDSILDAEWSRRGRGGMVCVVLGMKWWRMSFSSKDDKQLGDWETTLKDLVSAFKVIAEAKSL